MLPRFAGSLSASRADHVVLDAAGGQADRVRDGRAAARAVRDHDEPAQSEQVGAAVGVRVEPRAQAARRRPDEQAAERSRAAWP